MSEVIKRSFKSSLSRFFSERLELKSALKTSMAASLSLFFGLAFSKVFQRPDTLISGLWCVLATIVVLQPQLGGTYKAAWVRFSGVAIGSIVGSLFLIYLGADHPISLGASIFITIIICSLLNLKESFRIASLSTAIIMIFGGLHPNLNPWEFSFYRFIDSCIGIFVAVFVAHVLWAEKATVNLRLNILKIIRLLNKQYRAVIDLHLEHNVDTKTIDETFQEIQDLSYTNLDYLEEAKIELLNKSQKPEEWTFIIHQLELIYESIAALRNINLDSIVKIFDDSLYNHVTNIIVQTEAGFSDLDKLIDNEITPQHLESLNTALRELHKDLLRFRSTRSTRKFTLEDVENFYVFFYRIKNIGEIIVKMEEYIQNPRTIPLA